VTARTHGIDPVPSYGQLLDPPLLVARASGTAVTPLDRQRLTPPELRGK
jgi:3-aminobutyryl-CoA ammonia-lyase